MNFFDKDREVLEIVLTPLGKKQAVMGVFNPQYYEFYDNAVIYNPASFDKTETQNESAQRIKDSPSIKQQASRNEVGKQNISLNEDDNNLLLMPLGMADFESQFSPSWNISFNKGFVASVEEAEERTDRIPQLNTEITYKYIYSNNGSYKPVNTDTDEILLEKDLGNKTTVYILESNKIDVDIKEENTIAGKLNYEVECYIIENNSNEEDEYLVPILTKYDQEEQEKLLKYYFSIIADGKSLTLADDALMDLFQRMKEEENSVSLIDTNFDDAEKPC